MVQDPRPTTSLSDNVGKLTPNTYATKSTASPNNSKSLASLHGKVFLKLLARCTGGTDALRTF